MIRVRFLFYGQPFARLDYPSRLFSSPPCFLPRAEASPHFYQPIAFGAEFISPNHASSTSGDIVPLAG